MHGSARDRSTPMTTLVEFEGPLDLLRYASRGAELPFFEAVKGSDTKRSPATPRDGGHRRTHRWRGG